LFNFYAKTTDTILSIKERIKAEVGISVEKLALTLENGGATLKASKTVGDYDIRQGTTINYVVRRALNIKTPDGGTIDLLVLPTTKIS
jgi:hypothetical protein